MSARVVLAVAAVLTAGLARADDMHKVAPMEKVGASDSGASSSPGATWTKDASSGSHFSADASSDSHARPRTGSQSSSSAGQRHHSGASSRGGESRNSPPPQTAAQRRHPRPGTGTGHFDNNGHHGGGYGYGYPYYGYGYGYGRYGYGYGYYPYNSWYSPFYFSGYYGYSPSYYRGGGGYRESGSLRIIVDPEKTRVYVDGYYAGIVDDFDGVFQRLNVPPGRHEITLKLEGYRTQHFKVYVPVYDTIKIHYEMVRGSGEATSEQFAGVPADYARVEDMSDRRREDYDRDDDRYEARDESRDQGDTGSVRLRVTPQDASVYVDGEFRGSGRQVASLRLRPGRHRIEVVRPGYRTVEREVEVESGRSTEVEFDLEKL